jgi:hypothetical protein
MLVQACFEELRISYDEAFERLRSEVRLLRSTGGDARRLAQAELAYRESRDELAKFIIDRRPQSRRGLDVCVGRGVGA